MKDFKEYTFVLSSIGKRLAKREHADEGGPKPNGINEEFFSAAEDFCSCDEDGGNEGKANDELEWQSSTENFNSCIDEEEKATLKVSSETSQSIDSTYADCQQSQEKLPTKSTSVTGLTADDPSPKRYTERIIYVSKDLNEPRERIKSTSTDAAAFCLPESIVENSGDHNINIEAAGEGLAYMFVDRSNVTINDAKISVRKKADRLPAAEVPVKESEFHREKEPVSSKKTFESSKAVFENNEIKKGQGSPGYDKKNSPPIIDDGSLLRDQTSAKPSREDQKPFTVKGYVDNIFRKSVSADARLVNVKNKDTRRERGVWKPQKQGPVQNDASRGSASSSSEYQETHESSSSMRSTDIEDVPREDSLTKLTTIMETEAANVTRSDSKSSQIVRIVSEDNTCNLLGYNKHVVFYDMWRRGEFCDVTIKVNNINFEVHQLILAASSPYFEWLFLNSCETGGNSRLSLIINDISVETFESILQFVYTSETTIKMDEILPLLKASVALSIGALTEAINKFLLTCLRDECINAFCVASATGMDELHEVILDHIKKNFLEVSKSDQFSKCTSEHASRILADDDLRVNEEMDVLRAAMLWLDRHSRNSGTCLSLMRRVRFENISVKTLRRFMEDRAELLSNEEVRRYIMDAQKRASTLEPEHLYFDLPVTRRHIGKIAAGYISPSGVKKRLPSAKMSISNERSGSARSASNQKAGTPYRGMSKENGRATVRSSSILSQGFPSPSPKASFQEDVTIVDVDFGRSPPIRPEPHFSMSRKDLVSVTIATQFPSYHELDLDGSLDAALSEESIHSTRPDAIRSSQGVGRVKERPPMSRYLISIGGIAIQGLRKKPIDAVEAFKVGESSRWNQVDKIPIVMFDHAACFAHDSIYVTGGYNSVSQSNSSTKIAQGAPSHFLHEYDLVQRKWYQLTDMELGRANHQMVVLFGQIYVVGGEGADECILSSVERYSPFTNSWRQTAPMCCPRSGAAATVYHFQLWVAGGAMDSVTTKYGAITATVECYSPHNDSWIKVADLPNPRCNAALLRVRNRLYIVGGIGTTRPRSSKAEGTSSIHVYEDARDTWSAVTQIDETQCGNNAVSLGNKIFLLGRTEPNRQSARTGNEGIATYDITTRLWRNEFSNLPEAHTGNACCIVSASLSHDISPSDMSV